MSEATEAPPSTPPNNGVRGPGLPLAAGIAATFTVLALAAVALRFYVRTALRMDDFMALAAAVFLATHAGLTLATMVIGIAIANGLRNASYLQAPLAGRFKTVMRLAKALIIVYQLAATAVQLSIVALCIRISPAGPSLYRATAYTLGAVSITAAVTKAFVAILVPGVWYFTFAFTLVIDIVIWMLPLPLVFVHMRLSAPGKRLLAAAMFAIGLVPCATAAVRLVSATALHGDDCGEACAWLTLFDHIEIGLAIVCACMPPLQPLLISWARRRRCERARSAKAGGIAMSENTSASGWGSRIVRAGERRRIEAQLEGRIRVGRGPKGEIEIEVDGMGVLGSALPPPPAALRMSLNAERHVSLRPESIVVTDYNRSANHSVVVPASYNGFSASTDTVLSHYPPLSAARDLGPSPYRSDEALNSPTSK
ncbi:hypothetical protein DFH27DRAFT_393141 [Peziza echinospora]|nr:hypothetical protein DFH27DRAFT_393141 [Peziza echinospora]